MSAFVPMCSKKETCNEELIRGKERDSSKDRILQKNESWYNSSWYMSLLTTCLDTCLYSIENMFLIHERFFKRQEKTGFFLFFFLFFCVGGERFFCEKTGFPGNTNNIFCFKLSARIHFEAETNCTLMHTHTHTHT